MDNLGFELQDIGKGASGVGKERTFVIDIDEALGNGSIQDTEEDGAEKCTDDDGELDGNGTNIFGSAVVAIRSFLWETVVSNRRKFNFFLAASAIVLFHLYLAWVIWFTLNYNRELDWCGGVGFLIILTAVTYWGVFYYVILKPLLGRRITRGLVRPCRRRLGPLFGRTWFSATVGFLCLAGIVAFVVVDAWDQPKRLISAGGVVAVLVFGLLISKHPGRVRWRQVFWGLGLQFTFALGILRWESGRGAFDCLSGKVKTFLDFTDKGTSLVYDYLATGANVTTSAGDFVILRPVFIFKALSVIFFFSFFISILYHYGVMMRVISKLGWFLQVTVGTTAAESMNAAANIFIGQTEAPILIKPFLPDMTKSELHAVMTGGFATIAGSVMGAYISFGINPSFLLSASIMAAPAALAMSKLIYPETRKSRTTADQIKKINLKTANSALDAAAQGATQGVMLIGNIAANLIAFIAFVSFLNAIFNWFGRMAGADDLTFEWLLSKMFIPVSYVIGVDPEEAEDVALLLGLKTVVNEFLAYQRLASPAMAHLSARSKAIATYALCSFANFSSIGIQLGGIGFMAPERRAELAETIWYAFMAGTLCGLLNACLAGTLLSVPGFEPSLNATLSL